MSEMIERVKAAIGEKLSPVLDLRAPYAKVMVDAAARAAIEAMREPSAAMLEAGDQRAIDYWPHSEATPNAADCWQAMIDEMLKP